MVSIQASNQLGDKHTDTGRCLKKFILHWNLYQIKSRHRKQRPNKNQLLSTEVQREKGQKMVKYQYQKDGGTLKKIICIDI
jgi:hypothetical protein